METKVCSKCKEEKNVCEFGKLKSAKDGYRHFCKQCRKKIEKDYSVEDARKRRKKWRDNNRDKIRFHYIEKRQDRLDYQKKYIKENREKVSERRRKYYNENKEEILSKNKIYRSNNKDKRNNYEKNKKINSPVYSLMVGMRSRIWKYSTLLNITKKNRTFEIVGCSPQELKEHLEKQFVPGMSWENRAEWHIDHIIPLSSAKTEEELYKLCHYTNLQPLWVEENLQKSNKVL